MKTDFTMQIELRNIYFRYKPFALASGTNDWVLKNVNFSVTGHQITGIVGASGSGKTTLIQMLNGLLIPDRGEVMIDNKPAEYRGDWSSRWRRRVGIVFQFPELQFFANSIYDEIAYALRNQKLNEDQIANRIKQIDEFLKLPSVDLHKRSPFHLSEGQKRRVAIASILVQQPEILIFDEPTAGLDGGGIRMLKRTIRKIYESNHTVIIVSHDMDFVAELAERIVALSGGRIIFDGAREDFFLSNEWLTKTNLDPPQILSIVKELKRSGRIDKFPIFSVDELRNLLMKEHLGRR